MQNYPVNPHCIHPIMSNRSFHLHLHLHCQSQAKPSHSNSNSNSNSYRRALSQDSFNSRVEKSHPTMAFEFKEKKKRKSCDQTVATRIGARVHSGVGPRIDPGSRTTSPDAEILLRPCVGIGPRVLWNLRGPSAFDVHVQIVASF